MAKQVLRIYTDGSSIRTKVGLDAGGWAYCYYSGKDLISRSGAFAAVTNNQMELVAVIKALQDILPTKKSENQIMIVSDSQYVVNGASKWLVRWKNNKWMNFVGQPVANRELWEQLDYLLPKLDVRFFWVRGHAGHPQNEIADRLAREAANRAKYLQKTIHITDEDF